jgi:hypothetical protein
MTQGTTVNSKRFGTGTILSINGNKALVDFNGVEKTMFTMFLNEGVGVDNAAKKLAKTIAKNKVQKATAKDLFSSIVGNRETRHSNWQMTVNCSAIMQLADEKGSFISEIVENAINGKNVTEKQAWAVAYFAQKNNLI